MARAVSSSHLSRGDASYCSCFRVFRSCLPANWRALVGIAGLVAEEILRDGTDDAGVIADALHQRIWDGEASASDLTMMGITDIESYDLRDELVEGATRILRDQWEAVRQEAEYLIEFATE
ncbi:hypothetical protein NDK50_00175 [Paraburkholderia bryophila]|uniref:hypothetical protein n=1 Tax=Paraburkholderia bryophila TaxID=420952 RepID=UPI002349C843|nr:hypothetical protein [Paraburkholderia bryophila]WCM19939.1 hypothetical protein NDK50_00175 [Paraburkholderia bryophila]